MKHTKVYSCIIIRPCPLGSSPIRKLGSPYSMWYTLKKKKKKKRTYDFHDFPSTCDLRVPVISCHLMTCSPFLVGVLPSDRLSLVDFPHWAWLASDSDKIDGLFFRATPKSLLRA